MGSRRCEVAARRCRLESPRHDAVPGSVGGGKGDGAGRPRGVGRTGPGRSPRLLRSPRVRRPPRGHRSPRVHRLAPSTSAASVVPRSRAAPLASAAVHVGRVGRAAFKARPARVGRAVHVDRAAFIGRAAFMGRPALVGRRGLAPGEASRPLAAPPLGATSFHLRRPGMLGGPSRLHRPRCARIPPYPCTPCMGRRTSAVWVLWVRLIIRQRTNWKVRDARLSRG